MKLPPEQIKLLGLSSAEVKVLDALRSGKDTPLLISGHTKVSRPAIYEILERLHKRGLIKSNIRNGKKYWSQAKEKDLEQEIYKTKKALFGISDQVEEVHSLSDSTVIVHRGGDAIRTLLFGIIKDNKNQRLYGTMGDTIAIGWEKVFGTEMTNEINRFIKKNGIIVEGILPFGWFERQTKLLGVKWAKDFEGRMAINHEIEEEYFNHGGQVWIFKNSLYLIAMNEELIIEVRNSEIQKLILSMFGFIQDNSRKFDVNRRLRELIGES
jgi:predicted transcriptional regulator